jgi:hypothetical protein
VGTSLGRLREGALQVAQLWGELNIWPPALALANSDQMTTASVKSRRKLFLHPLCAEIAAPDVSGDHQLHETF